MIKPQQSILCSFLGKGHLGRNWNDNLREPCSQNKCKERPEAAGVRSRERKNNEAEQRQGSTSSCAHLNLSCRGCEPPGNPLTPAGRTCLSLQCVWGSRCSERSLALFHISPQCTDRFLSVSLSQSRVTPVILSVQFYRLHKFFRTQ